MAKTLKNGPGSASYQRLFFGQKRAESRFSRPVATRFSTFVLFFDFLTFFQFFAFFFNFFKKTLKFAKTAKSRKKPVSGPKNGYPGPIPG
jgi:hypothetical protein